jgi:hypothetical protein
MLLREYTSQGVLHPVCEVGYLEYLGKKGHKNTRTDKKYQHRDTPDEVIYRAVDIGNGFNHLVSPLIIP